MTRLVKQAVLALILAGFASQASAVIVDEALLGTDYNSAGNVGNVEIGSNLFIGNIMNGPDSIVDGGDIIQFRVPNGLQINAVSFAVTAYTSSPAGATEVWGQVFDSNGLYDQVPAPLTGVGVADFSASSFPVGPGDYELRSFFINHVFGADADYVFRVIVSPEPASLALLGLGGLVMIRRRR